MRINPTKLKRYAKINKTVFDVFFWLATVSFIGVLLAFIATFFIPDRVFVFSSMSGEGGVALTMYSMVRVNVDPSIYSSVSIKPLLQTVLPLALVVSFLLVCIIHQVRMILKTVADDCPFDKQNPKRLSIVGAALIIGSLIVNVAEARVASVMVDLYKINNITINYSVNISMLLTGILIVILAGVFQYGTYLQEEYDATL